MLKFSAFVVISVVVLWCGCCSGGVPSQKIHLRNARYLETNICSDCVCGESKRWPKIVGGNVTKPYEFPWLVGLSKGGEFYCGAAVISHRHLLTAAHCVEGFEVRQITAVLGDYDREATNRFSKISIRGVRTINQHDQFDKYSYNNDIAILELDSPIEFDENIQPICLPESGIMDYSGKFAVVAGWGRTMERGKPSSVLRKVTVPVWSKQQCVNSGYGEEKLSENMFCAGYPEGRKDACQGDSGGPLHVKNKRGHIEVAGIVSWGRGCARPNLPGVYTKVTNYLDWIQQVLDGQCLCPPASYS